MLKIRFIFKGISAWIDVMETCHNIIEVLQNDCWGTKVPYTEPDKKLFSHVESLVNKDNNLLIYKRQKRDRK